MNVQISCCQYLFGKAAEKVFSNIKEMRIEEKRDYIDQCLDLMMRVNVYILTRKEGFCLIDPMAYNNQCHLYALRAAEIKTLYNTKTHEERLAKTEENRFLHLSFFLSYTLATDTKLMLKTTLAAMKEMGEDVPKFKRKLGFCPFDTFIQDKGRCRERASRLALNEVFKTHLRETLKHPCEENKQLYGELSQLAQENLLTASSRGKKEGILYTFPKLAGVAYLVDVIRREQIPIVIKVKVITKEGAAGSIIATLGNIAENKPVIVFEGLATDGKSIKECRNDAKKCPHYFYRDIKNCHETNENCFYCKTTSEVDLKQNLEDMHFAIASSTDMLYALGADFLLNCQSEFKHHFEKKDEYPLLTDLFEKAIPKIAELGLDMNHPQTFSVCHVHMDIGAHALSNHLLLDQTHEQFLDARGLI